MKAIRAARDEKEGENKVPDVLPVGQPSLEKV